MKSKKGQKLLGEHSVQLVIAVLSLVILIFLGFALYGFFIKEDTELRQAEASLDKILNEMKLLEEGNTQLVLFNPSQWTLVSYVDVTSDIPKSCLNEQCLCICEYSGDQKKLFDNCNSAQNGICKIFSGVSIARTLNPDRPPLIDFQDNIEIKGITQLNITKTNNFYEIEKI